MTSSNLGQIRPLAPAPVKISKIEKAGIATIVLASLAMIGLVALAEFHQKVHLSDSVARDIEWYSVYFGTALLSAAAVTTHLAKKHRKSAEKTLDRLRELDKPVSKKEIALLFTAIILIVGAAVIAATLQIPKARDFYFRKLLVLPNITITPVNLYYLLITPIIISSLGYFFSKVMENDAHLDRAPRKHNELA